MIFDDQLPYYLSIGISAEEFFHSTPRILKAYSKGYMLKMKRYDEMIYSICGNYVLSAVAVAVEHCLAGRKAKAEFIKTPMLKDLGKSKEEILREQGELFLSKLEMMRANFELSKVNKENGGG